MRAAGRGKIARSTRDRSGVTEVVGTLLMLGITVTLTGVIAIWATQIDQGEEGLYVDLYASTQGNTLVILHRGGDILSGPTTTITLTDSSGTGVLQGSYRDLSGTND